LQQAAIRVIQPNPLFGDSPVKSRIAPVGALVTPSKLKEPVIAAPVTADTPSKVKAMVASMNAASTPKAPSAPTSAKPTPGSSAKIKAVVECLEATISAGTPRTQAATTPKPSIERASSRLKQTRSATNIEHTPQKQESFVHVEQVTTTVKRGRKAAQASVEEPQGVTENSPEVKRSRRRTAEESKSPVKKSEGEEGRSISRASSKREPVVTTTTSSRKKKTTTAVAGVTMDTIPEESTARPSRRAKLAANEGLIKK